MITRVWAVLRKARARVTRSSRAPSLTAEHQEYARFAVGSGSCGEPEVVFWDCGATLRIGRYSSIVPGVTILLGGEHHTDWVTT